MSSEKLFKLPNYGASDAPWGPPATVPEALRFNDVPYAPYFKGDKLGKLSDWTDPNKDAKDNKRPSHRNYRDPYHAYGASAAASFFTNEDAEDPSSFSLVDSSKTPKPKQTAVLKTKNRNSTAPRSSPANKSSPGTRPQGGAQQRGAAPSARRRFGWKEERPQKNRDASVKITEDWKLIQSNTFSELQKLSFQVGPGSDVAKYGYVYPYNRNLDKPSLSQKLQLPERSIYNTTTSDDPVIQQLSSENAASVFITDSIISLIMCATKSVYPWDVIINKRDGKIFFDKRDDGPLDYITVDENSFDPPSDTDKTNINSATRLGIEATYINQNFAANAVVENDSQKIKFENQNPFNNPEEDKVAPPLPSGYRYRKFNLADNLEEEPINLVVRTEIDAVAPGNPESYITVNALNEYGPNGVLEWKRRFVNQRGAIVAAEMKKNLNKLSRWTVESLLAGASSMKIGFVSRLSPKDYSHHIIVGVVGQVPSQFASQINLKLSNGWGIFKSVVNIIAELDDGKYVLLKDPNASTINIYKVPSTTFEEESSDEE